MLLDSPSPARSGIFVTTTLKPGPALIARAAGFARELGAPLAARRNEGMAVLYERYPAADRALIVQEGRLMLSERQGATLFYHPNMAYLRLGNLLRGGRDLLVEAVDVGPGDSVLDATLGHASEAILCAHVVGPEGEVHGVEASPELGILLREGLKTVRTAHAAMNAAMRTIEVIHIGDHLDYLRACPSDRYDVVCFDPFFDEILHNSESFEPLRTFGDHGPLLPEALREAQRVARRRVVVKAVKWADTLDRLGAPQKVESKYGKISYGVFPAI
jgi:16S rRNA (guanine1516-N2)-methyltransferase